MQDACKAKTLGRRGQTSKKLGGNSMKMLSKAGGPTNLFERGAFIAIRVVTAVGSKSITAAIAIVIVPRLGPGV